MWFSIYFENSDFCTLWRHCWLSGKGCLFVKLTDLWYPIFRWRGRNCVSRSNSSIVAEWLFKWQQISSLTCRRHWPRSRAIWGSIEWGHQLMSTIGTRLNQISITIVWHKLLARPRSWRAGCRRVDCYSRGNRGQRGQGTIGKRSVTIAWNIKRNGSNTIARKTCQT